MKKTEEAISLKDGWDVTPNVCLLIDRNGEGTSCRNDY